MVTKIIANKIKPFLARTMSQKLLGFMVDRQILDAIGVTQNFLHSIKVKYKDEMMLKMDLAKAYD